MSTDEEIQKAKEEARRLALQLGIALERHEDRIETVGIDGKRAILVDNQPTDSIWIAAREAMETQLGKGAVPNAKATVQCNAITAYGDGGSRGNPGPSASGFVLYDTATEAILEEGGEYLGITTNNQAEYHAVLLILQHSLAYSPRSLTLYLDSLLVVNQLIGKYKVKSRDLWPVHQAIKELITRFDEFSVHHVPRERNSAADSMVNQILDQHM